METRHSSENVLLILLKVLGVSRCLKRYFVSSWLWLFKVALSRMFSPYCLFFLSRQWVCRLSLVRDGTSTDPRSGLCYSPLGCTFSPRSQRLQCTFSFKMASSRTHRGRTDFWRDFYGSQFRNFWLLHSAETHSNAVSGLYFLRLAVN